MEPLDNPIWHALTGAQAQFAEGTGLARRYNPDVAMFGALPDDPTPDAWDALRALVGPGGTAILARRNVVIASGWEVAFRGEGHQYVAPANFGDDADPARFVTLGLADAPEMLALVARTRPGPFEKRTVELGGYRGWRDESGALVAMAGERMRPRGCAEISAVCTDDAHRGRGLATALMHTVARGIRDRGEQPILHVAAENDTAIGLYERLGFVRRATMGLAVLTAPR